MQSTILALQQQLRDCKQLLSKSQEQVLDYEEKLKTTESVLADMRQQNSSVSSKSEDQQEHAQAKHLEAEIRTNECELSDSTSPATQSEERILHGASRNTPTKHVPCAPAAFSISQLLGTDSNSGSETKKRDAIENGGDEHKSATLEPSESPLVAAMGLVERIGCDSNTFNGEVTG